MDALLLHRLHFAFTVTYHYLFPQLTMGLALLIVVLKTVALVRHNERYNEAARFWAKIFAINFSDRRRYRHSHGISVRHQLGAVLPRHRRRDRAAPRHGRRFLLLSGIRLSGPFPVRRKASLAVGPLGIGLSRLRGLMDIRLLHHRHRRLDAASRRLSASFPTDHSRCTSFWRTAAEPLGAAAVRAQHVRRRRYRLVS